MLNISNRVKGKIARAIFAVMFFLLIGTVGSMEVFEMSVREGLTRMAIYTVVGVAAGTKGGVFR